MLFSTLTDSSLTAVAAALVLVIIMEALGAFEVFDFLSPTCSPAVRDAWTNFLSSPVDWEPIIKALITFAVWIVGTTGLAYWRFRSKDVLS